MADVADAKLLAARAWLDPAGRVRGPARRRRPGGDGRDHRAGRHGRDRRGLGALPRGRHGGRGRADPRDRRRRTRRDPRPGVAGRRPGSVRALLQRVSRAEVRVGGAVVGSIGAGLLVLLGVGPRRRRGDGRRAGAEDLRAADLRGCRGADEPLVARRRRGGAGGQPVHALRGHEPGSPAGVHRRRPPPDVARPLWLQGRGRHRGAGVRTALGEFGAEMAVELVNDGPFTIWLDTADR